VKKVDKIKKEAELTMIKVRAIARHIRNVEDNCLILGEKLIGRGEVELGHKLIANGYCHDISKFSGIEWDNMTLNQPSAEESAKLKFKLAIQHHNRTNPHHPEYWGGIQFMPRLYLAEMTADWKARSEEFGTSLREWINEQATKRFHFTPDERVYREIMEFVDLLCEKPFEQISQT
jgi:hypothetical protein